MQQPKEISPMLIGLLASVGMFLSTLDSGIINIALPTLLAEFNSPINRLIWVVTLYMLALSASIMLFGRLADRWGRLKIYKYGLMLFGLSSLLCGWAHSSDSLIIFRGLQGIGAAMMQATAAAIIMTQVNETLRPKIMGILVMISGLGPLMGPVIGGLILSSIGWRWIFWLNIPICILALMGLNRLKFQERLFEKPLNLLSLFLFGLIITLILLMLSTLSGSNIHLTTLLSAGVCVLAAVILSFCEFRLKHPILGRDLLKNSNFVLPLLATIAFGGTATIILMLPPLFFEGIKRIVPWKVGLINLFAPIGLVLCARASGYLIHKIGTEKLMVMGLSGMMLSLGVFTTINETWGYIPFIVLLLIYGIGAGFFQTANNVHILQQSPPEKQASVGAFLRMVQNAGIAIAAAASAAFISVNPEANPAYFLQGMKESWVFAFLMVMVTLPGCIVILKRKRSSEIVGQGVTRETP